MDKVDQYKQKLEKELSDDKKPWTKYLNIIEEKTQVPKLYIFLGKYRFLSSISIIITYMGAH